MYSLQTIKPERRLVVFAICFLLLFARRPSTVLRPQFWAEDGTIFFYDQVTLGLKALLHPYAGYLHLCSRTIAALAGGFGTKSAPLAFNVAALIIAAFCCSEFARTRYRSLLNNDLLRAALCILMSSVIPAYELVGNVANLQWFMVVAATPFVLVAQPATKYERRFLYPAIGLFLALSAPALLILLPILMFRVRRRVFSPLTAALCVGLAIQLSVFMNTFHAVPPGNALTFTSFIQPVLVALSNQVILPCILGQRHAFSLVTKGSEFAGPLAICGFLAFVVALGVKSAPAERSKLLAAVWLIFSSLGIALAAREGVRALLPNFSHAIRFGSDRYFFCAGCMFLYCLALGVEHWGRDLLAVRPRVAAYFVLLFGLSGTINFHIGSLQDLHWGLYAPAIDDWRQARKNHHYHAALSVPVNPDPWHIDLPTIP